MKDKLSLIYETSMEKRKALMDARIKKGSALTPEEEQNIIAGVPLPPKQPKRSNYEYGYIMDVCSAYVPAFTPNYIDLSKIRGSCTNVKWDVASGHDMPLVEYIDFHLVEQMCEHAVTMAANEMETGISDEETVLSEADQFKITYFKDAFEHSMTPEEANQTIPPYIHVTGMCDRTDNIGFCCFYFGYAYRRDKTPMQNGPTSNKCEEALFKRREKIAQNKKELVSQLFPFNQEIKQKIDPNANYAQWPSWVQFATMYNMFVS